MSLHAKLYMYIDDTFCSNRESTKHIVKAKPKRNPHIKIDFYMFKSPHIIYSLFKIKGQESN